MQTEIHPIVLYQAVNSVNGKKYIGITKVGFAKRVARHRHTAKCGGGAVIGAALRKYGDAIKFSVMVVCPTFEYAKDMEVAAIAAFKPEYNVTKGGDGALGFRHSDEHRKRVSVLMKGKKSFLGIKHSPETIEKMRQARKNYWQNHKKPPKPKVKTFKLVNRRNSRILLENTGEIFPTVNAASAHLGIDRKSLRNICRGIYKSKAGIRVSYCDDFGAARKGTRHQDGATQ